MINSVSTKEGNQDKETSSQIRLTLEELNAIVETALGEAEKRKSFKKKLAKAWEKQFYKNAAMVPAFALGWLSNSSSVKTLIQNLF